MSDLKWEKFTRTLEIEAVQVTAGNILDLAREFNGAVKYNGLGLVYVTDCGYEVPLGGYVRRGDGDILDTNVWSKAVEPEPEPEPTYKEGERVEVHGWSPLWCGPATVLAQPTDTHPYYQIRTDGGREGGFTEAYLRPLEAEPEYKVKGHGDFKIGDRVREVADAWDDGLRCNTGPGTVTGLNSLYIEVTFDVAENPYPSGNDWKVYDAYDAWQLERVE